MTPSDGARVAQAVRRGAGLFAPSGRGLLEVRGGDRVRWLQGQISNDVAVLAPGQGCYATVLTVKGRIVGDLHVLAREDGFWLATGADALAAVRVRLERYIVADDVTLADASERFAWLALEGPAVPAVLREATGSPVALVPEATGSPVALVPEAATQVTIAGHELVAWAWGTTNLPACQLLAAPAAVAPVREALLAAGKAHGLVAADADALEVLRIESGVPALGAELDEEVFPAEARLDRAISTTKGCYTGQEIVERIRSRGDVHYRLVGLRFDLDGGLPEPGSALRSEAGKRVGDVTSVALSAAAGAIGLGYVRRELEAPGTELRLDGGTARVAALPLVAPGGAGAPG